MKHARLLSFLLAALLVLSSCSIGMADSLEDAAEVSVDTSEMFTDRDLEIGYDEEDSAYITLSNDSSTTTSPAVAISGNTVTIQGEGVYSFIICSRLMRSNASRGTLLQRISTEVLEAFLSAESFFSYSFTSSHVVTRTTGIHQVLISSSLRDTSMSLRILSEVSSVMHPSFNFVCTPRSIPSLIPFKNSS